MGRRRLAYTVRKFNDGFYVLYSVAAEGAQVAELERRLRVQEQVIKFITVRTDEEDKRLAKVKALRDSKVKRSTLPQVQASRARAGRTRAGFGQDRGRSQQERGGSRCRDGRGGSSRRRRFRRRSSTRF